MSRPDFCTLKYNMQHVSDVRNSGLHEERCDFAQTRQHFLVPLCKKAKVWNHILCSLRIVVLPVL